ncbi:MAG: YciI family protein [Parvibaculum sp.]|uniref:YciI family protein n=1 Tax=Parvibaculum sp. TaxID=2024848 RepID=UPI003C738B1B
MHFCFTGIDKPDSLALRLANRDAHLKHWADAGCVKVGGPFSSDDGTVMNGSMLIIEVDDRATADRLVAEDPYNVAGLFQRVEVRAWKWLLGPK